MTDLDHLDQKQIAEAMDAAGLPYGIQVLNESEAARKMLEARVNQLESDMASQWVVRNELKATIENLERNKKFAERGREKLLTEIAELKQANASRSKLGAERDKFITENGHLKQTVAALQKQLARLSKREVLVEEIKRLKEERKEIEVRGIHNLIAIGVLEEIDNLLDKVRNSRSVLSKDKEKQPQKLIPKFST